MCRFCEQVARGHDAPYDPQLGRGGFIPGANMPPDLILCDGPVVTMNDVQPEATAIAIREGVIQAVGKTDDVMARRGRGTRVVKLEGRAVLPGFIGTGLRLPEERIRATLDQWIEGRARAGFTAVDVTTLGRNWTEYETLSKLVDRRHRLRLRGAAEDGLRRDWRGGALDAGHGNDLVRIEAVLLGPPLDESTIAYALSVHGQGWGVVFDCMDDVDLTTALQLVRLAAGRSLAGMRVLAPRVPNAAEAQILRSVGLFVVTPIEHRPADAFLGSRDMVLAHIDRVTRQAARLSGMSGIAGQIRPGCYADFTLLDRSPFWPSPNVPHVVGTWIEGIPVRPEAEHIAA